VHDRYKVLQQPQKGPDGICERLYKMMRRHLMEMNETAGLWCDSDLRNEGMNIKYKMALVESHSLFNS
jgi:hypothetical protein